MLKKLGGILKILGRRKLLGFKFDTTLLKFLGEIQQKQWEDLFDIDMGF